MATVWAALDWFFQYGIPALCTLVVTAHMAWRLYRDVNPPPPPVPAAAAAAANEANANPDAPPADANNNNNNNNNTRRIRIRLSAVLVLGAVLVLMVLMILSPRHAPRMGAADDNSGDLSRILYEDGTPYILMPITGTKAAATLPIVGCTHHDWAAVVMDRLLGPPVLAIGGGHGRALANARDPFNLAPPPVETDEERDHKALQRARQRALSRCIVLPPAAGTTVDSGDESAFIARATHAATDAVPSAGDRLAVQHVLVAKNATRYYRVWLASARGDTAVAPVVVSEDALLQWARAWHRRFLDMAERNEHVYPCLCAAHFGLVGSGVHFYYDTRARQWRLLLRVAILRSVSLVGQSQDMVLSGINYTQYLTRFPRDADAPFGVSTLEHPDMVAWAYMDPARLTEERVRETEPTWLHKTPATAAEDEESEPYMAVLSLGDLWPVPDYVRLSGHENACLQHCHALDKKTRGGSE